MVIQTELKCFKIYTLRLVPVSVSWDAAYCDIRTAKIMRLYSTWSPSTRDYYLSSIPPMQWALQAMGYVPSTVLMHYAWNTKRGIRIRVTMESLINVGAQALFGFHSIASQRREPNALASTKMFCHDRGCADQMCFSPTTNITAKLIASISVLFRGFSHSIGLS